MSKTAFDNITRSALWTAYNNICFYCSRPLDWNDLHIDHIIPEFLSEEKVKFDKIISDFDLDTNFDFNALSNLVPTHSKCNLRKSHEVFPKVTTLFYLALALKTKPKVELEIEKLKRRKNKGQILSKLQSALSTNLIDTRELKEIILEAEKNNWDSTQIKIPIGIEFIDEVYDVFYLNSDLSILLDKKLLLGDGSDSLELMNDNHNICNVSTLREWKEAISKDYYPMSTFAIKMSSSFSFLEDIVDAIQIAKMPKVSFISEPWIEIDDLDFLSPSILHDFEGRLTEYTEKGLSIGDLVKQGIVKIDNCSIFKISLQYEGFETSLIEQFRADFNNDGIEDIFVRGWTRALHGTMGYGFTTILTKYSNKHLIEEIVDYKK